MVGVNMRRHTSRESGITPRFKMVARIMDGSKVFGYLLQRSDGLRYRVSRDSAFDLAVSGQIYNCKARETLNGKLFTGVGVNLTDLPVIKYIPESKMLTITGRAIDTNGMYAMRVENKASGTIALYDLHKISELSKSGCILNDNILMDPSKLPIVTSTWKGRNSQATNETSKVPATTTTTPPVNPANPATEVFTGEVIDTLPSKNGVKSKDLDTDDRDVYTLMQCRVHISNISSTLGKDTNQALKLMQMTGLMNNLDTVFPLSNIGGVLLGALSTGYKSIDSTKWASLSVIIRKLIDTAIKEDPSELVRVFNTSPEEVVVSSAAQGVNHSKIINTVQKNKLATFDSGSIRQIPKDYHGTTAENLVRSSAILCEYREKWFNGRIPPDKVVHMLLFILSASITDLLDQHKTGIPIK